MKAEQIRLMFRSGLTVTGDKFIDVTVSETGVDRWTVMSITPRGSFESSPSTYKLGDTYFPFSPGLEYTKTQITDFCAANNYSLLIASAENSAAVALAINVGTTSTPTAGSITSSGATISWTNTNATRNAGIKIYKKLTSAADSTYVLVASQGGTTTSKALTGLTTGTGYTVKIVPYNAYGESLAPKTVAFTTS